jgi:hypothetical protein
LYSAIRRVAALHRGRVMTRRTGLFFLSMLALSAGARTSTAGVHQLVEERFSRPGPWEVRHWISEQPCDREGNLCDVYYPVMKAGLKAPLVSWGNGTDETPSPRGKYEFLLRHLASWGFVIVATQDGSTGSGETIGQATAFALAVSQDEGSPLYDRVDPLRIATAGHSQGASGAANAMLNSGGAIQTTLLFHIPQQAFCHPPASCLRTEDLRAARSGAFFYVTGSRDFIISPDGQLWGDQLNSLNSYYEATPVGPKVKAVIEGADHNDLQGRPDCPPRVMGCAQGVRRYLGFPTAWLAWRLRGDADAGQAFRRDGELIRADGWTSVRTDISAAGR